MSEALDVSLRTRGQIIKLRREAIVIYPPGERPPGTPTCHWCGYRGPDLELSDYGFYACIKREPCTIEWLRHVGHDETADMLSNRIEP